MDRKYTTRYTAKSDHPVDRVVYHGRDNKKTDKPELKRKLVNHSVRVRPAAMNHTPDTPKIKPTTAKRSGALKRRAPHIIDDTIKPSVAQSDTTARLAPEDDQEMPTLATKNQSQPKSSTVLKRQLVQKPLKTQQKKATAEPKQIKRQRIRGPAIFKWRTVFSLAIAVVTMSGVGIGAAYIVNNEAGTPERVLSESDQRASSIQTEQPVYVSEDFISAEMIRNYSVEPTNPRRIKISSIDIEARIKAAGVDYNNQLTLPDNIHDVNWYEGSREPGRNGTVLLSGYVSGMKERGIFYYLRALEHGDEISIETGDGTMYHYEVQHREFIPYDEIDVFSLLVPFEKDNNSLHIVAVDNRYNVMNNGYQDRLVIYATQQ